VDLLAFVYLYDVHVLFPDTLVKFDKLREFQERMAARPRISEYLCSTRHPSAVYIGRDGRPVVDPDSKSPAPRSILRLSTEVAQCRYGILIWRVIMRNALVAAASFTLVVALNGSVFAATMQGHFRCGITDYMWPSSLEDAPTAAGNAMMEFDSDGNGRFTTGSLSEHLVTTRGRSERRYVRFN